MSAKDFAAPWPSITTAAEREHLTSKKSASGPTYEMTGRLAAEVRQSVKEDEFQRANAIARRLQEVRETVLNEHAIANVRDRARSDFERGR